MLEFLFQVSASLHQEWQLSQLFRPKELERWLTQNSYVLYRSRYRWFIAVIELSSAIILHRFNSPAWLKHIQKSVVALNEIIGRTSKWSHLMNMLKTFEYGSSWLRADFHLHTNKDREFMYSGEETRFISEYVDGLKNAGIQIGVITNHNKFEISEFKALRKKAKKEEIFLLPGVELSVKDGRNGIHTLIVFSDEWCLNKENKDYINDFLNVTFAGQNNFYNENARSNHDIIETIRELDKFNKDYFIIFAHVEADNGLWCGLSGGRLEELGKNEMFKKMTLGFQKVETHDVPDRCCRKKVLNFLNHWYPAEVEGSDCKSIDEIGRSKACYLKIGDFTFEAVKYALIDYHNRVSGNRVKSKHSNIKSISFTGGTLDGEKIRFSPELNALIGIRGSGKSSIIETIRYVLGIPFGEKVTDADYKESLVSYTLGSGGKVIVEAIDQHGQVFEIRRILNDQSEVFIDDKLQPGISIRETILNKPVYFGQKDLSQSGEGFEKDLVEKLLGEKLYEIREKIEQQKQVVYDHVDRLAKLSSIDAQKKEYENKKQDAEFRLKKFKEYNIEEKLEKQVNFEADSQKIKLILDSAQAFLGELSELIDRFEDDLKNHKIYKSKQNSAFFSELFPVYEKILDVFDNIKKSMNDGLNAFNLLKSKRLDFEKIRKGLKEEFAEVERALAGELKATGVQSIRPDEFLELKKTVDQAKLMLKSFNSRQTQRNAIEQCLTEALSGLNELWHQEFRIIQTELENINQNQTALQIVSEYKGDKKAFLAYMKDMFRGSRIRENTFQGLITKYSDFGNMYRDHINVLSEISGSADTFNNYFENSLKALLTYQVPNRFTIKYHDKELKHHSLGQRASALILFVLSRNENDVIIIDQPEDDLDNQTIYEDVIKLIRMLKQRTQFIFATHNANIPVLGDCEMIHSCFFNDDKVKIKSGSIDNPVLQKEIVNVMEGGREAFNRRKEIYGIWKPRSF